MAADAVTPGLFLVLWALRRQSEEKRSSQFYRGFGPYFSPMCPDNPRDRSQANASTCKFRNPVHPLENSEEFLSRPHVETSAVIANEVDSLAILILEATLDTSRIVFARELPGVAQKILQGHVQEIGIAYNSYSLLNNKLHRALRLALAKCFGNSPSQGAEID
jgi:hypothetical protein